MILSPINNPSVMTNPVLKIYPSKGPYMMPSTGPNIWQEQHPTAKPSIIELFHPSALLTYVTTVYPSKYLKVVLGHIPLIATF